MKTIILYFILLYIIIILVIYIIIILIQSLLLLVPLLNHYNIVTCVSFVFVWLASRQFISWSLLISMISILKYISISSKIMNEETRSPVYWSFSSTHRLDACRCHINFIVITFFTSWFPCHRTSSSPGSGLQINWCPIKCCHTKQHGNDTIMRFCSMTTMDFPRFVMI